VQGTIFWNQLIPDGEKLTGTNTIEFASSYGYYNNTWGEAPFATPVTYSASVDFNNYTSLTSEIYQNYINGGDLGKSYGLANATSVQKQQLAQLQTKMNLITSQINNLTSRFGSGTIASEDQSKKNVSGLGDYLTSLTNTNKKISNFSENVDNILDDSDIVVLQKNYDYLFWTILASGTVLVSINLVKQ
jgi:hypothetical protein